MEKIIIQPELCDGCLDCQDACAQIHGTSGILVREVEGSYYPIICQQCEDAPCEVICPTEAIGEGGIDEDRCIGCGLCVTTCPANALKLERKPDNKLYTPPPSIYDTFDIMSLEKAE